MLHSTTLIVKVSLFLAKSWVMNVHRKLQKVLRFDSDVLLQKMLGPTGVTLV